MNGENENIFMKQEAEIGEEGKQFSIPFCDSFCSF